MKFKIKSWNDLYKKHGILQKEIMPNVKVFSSTLLNKKLPSYKVLDSGCGTGRHTLYILETFSQQSMPLGLESIDGSEEAISIVKTLLKEKEKYFKPIIRCHLSIHDLNNPLPFNDNEFEGIISTLVIEHGKMSQINFWITEMKRVLKSGGIIALTVPSVDDPRFETGTEIEPGTKINTDQSDGEIPHHFFKDDEIEGLFSGYKILYKHKVRRQSVTSNVIAKHLEYVLMRS